MTLSARRNEAQRGGNVKTLYLKTDQRKNAGRRI